MLSTDEKLQALREWCYDKAPDHVCERLVPQIDFWEEELTLGRDLHDSAKQRIDDLCSMHEIC